MADIVCAVCSEPWDSYGVTHGDMAKWEAVLFRKGAGCPACEGQAPKGQDPADHVEDHLRSVVMESEDPDSFPLLHNPDVKRPEWKRPEDEAVFSCAGCDSQLRRNADDSDLYWHTPTVDRYYHHRPGGYDWATDVDELYTIADKKYCFACATSCDDCGEPVFHNNTSCTGTTLYGDTYNPGASFAHPDHCGKTICIECLEKIPTCAYCGATLDEDDKTDDQGYGPCCSEEKESNEDEDEDEESDESNYPEEE